MTLPDGSAGEGGGSAATTPAAATPCSASVKTWMVASDRPRTPILVARGGTIGYPPITGTPHLTGLMVGSGGWVLIVRSNSWILLVFLHKTIFF